MIAIRQIQEVKSGAVTVALPVDFHGKRVEIIILPVEESNNGAKICKTCFLRLQR